MPTPSGYGFDSANVNVFAYGDRHVQVRYLGPSGVSLHPLQRNGSVGARSHNFAQNARIGAAGWGTVGSAQSTPAGLSHVTFPPVVQIAGSPRDPRVMV
jgi:hypothetical protein